MRARAVLAEGDHAHHDVAGVRDRGVGEQALHVRLGQRGDVADRHRQHGNEHEDVRPVDGPGQVPGAGALHGHAAEEEPQHDREPGRLGGHGQEGGHRRRRALVHVGAPEVERHRRRLEAEPGEDEQGDDVHGQAVGVGEAGAQHLADHGQARAARSCRTGARARRASRRWRWRRRGCTSARPRC